MADEENEFQEEEMWSVASKGKQRKGAFSFKKKKSLISSSSTSCLSTAWHSPLPSTPKMMIPKAKNVVKEGDNLAPQQYSAPMKIPGHYGGKDAMKNGNEYDGEKDDDDDEEDGEMIPPHEYIAKKMERTRIASHSMCEGVGRTLKGRDLCNLRNAILSQTGFLEK